MAISGGELFAQTGGIDDPELVVRPLSLPLQAVGRPFVDPVFGTVVRRVSDRSEHGGFETQIYNQLQAFSSDNVYLLLVNDSSYIIRRMSDFSPVTGIATWTWNAPRWHPTRAHTIVHFDSNDDTILRLQFTDVDTRTTSTMYTFPERYERILSNQSFDEISEDGIWLAGMALRNDGEPVIFSLNIEHLQLGAEMAISDLYANHCAPDPQWGEVEPDWVGVSPLGKYLVVQWIRNEMTRCSGLETYDIRTGAFVGRVAEHHNHGDLGIDTDGGTEYFMTGELSSSLDPNRPSLAIRLLPGLSTASPPRHLRVIEWSDEDHVSCRGPMGMGLYSWGNVNGQYDYPFKNELFLQYTDGTVLRLVHHRSSKCGYWVQPRASISRDGRYVVFASDWAEETGIRSCDRWSDPMGRGDPYVIDLRAGSVGVQVTAPVQMEQTGYILSQNFPNPFHSSTSISFWLPPGSEDEQPVELSVSDALGRHVVMLVQGGRAPGWHFITWDGRDSAGNRVPPGPYFCTLAGPSGIQNRVLTLLP